MSTEYVDMYTVRLLARQAGSHFFDREAMRFFDSRASSEAIKDNETGNYYFVTSEKFDHTTPRMYTARVMTPTGDISDVGEFQQYASSSGAWNRIKRELGM